ncbi:integrase family protein [Diaphorobacter limosus]|uniref:Integrase family protein n=1 Tax=Diaphorobacter limosus TaxID=3036128 RepID=A0ABZ0J3U0_9BURK|nr:integrase family protein [Diaphorobacter sp. Y-1]WOO32851.1 integrase family protein [Diaphorobacter sp. Y-1]
MVRPRKTDVPDTTRVIDLTAGAIERLTCRTDSKAQAFLRDAKAPGLRVRVTNTGHKAFVFEAKLNRQTIRRTIGDVRAWTIEQARTEARRLAVLIDAGINPNEQERQQQAAAAAEQAAAAAQAVTVGAIWPLYLENGKPKRKEAWKPRYRADLEAMAAPGGEPKKRGQGVTRPGPLHPLLALPLAGVTEDALQVWFEREAQAGRHQATRALMMFRGFLRWCASRPEYRALTDRDAGKAPAIVENLAPSTTRRTDCLEAAQVAAWWQCVDELGNRTASAYLRALLLTGARREEVAALTWANVDFQWRKLTIADKASDSRTIPLSPYLAQLLATLPRQGPFVFASTGKAGRITDARASHATALQRAGIGHLTFHGLRRSFSLLGEAAGAPAGAIAQIMGHRPSAVAEGYRPRSIDALRPYSAQIEAHILALAGVQLDAQAEPGKLRIVAHGNSQ